LGKCVGNNESDRNIAVVTSLELIWSILSINTTFPRQTKKTTHKRHHNTNNSNTWSRTKKQQHETPV